MLRWLTSGTAMAALAAVLAGPAPAAQETPVQRDLTAVIALQGLPCGQVVTAVRQGDNDYVVSCQDGNRYRVFINADGRVVVEKR